ncbi:cationic amino acid transporter 2-like [Galleria mellonella]|uniref:Cationic amino acid transporter 2-like n=1 Tax=Galleria mellonella TaxID=7137 RepID=A0A6J1WXL2_GALME|nr:cationic amino acid transporter 2-like [Galleria mellonella]XP_026760975.1 cationic amino acid transporter 2-like [Galleria mellonella]
MACTAFWTSVKRTRVFTPEQLDAGNLRRCLSRWELTGLGVGSTLGIGVYLLLGYVAYKLAGPSVVLSFLIAAVAAFFAALCYAEFASRVPRAGSAYIYTYVSVGELAAFVVGWNNILEGLFGTASIARGLSLFVDSTVNNSMSEWFTTFASVADAPFSQYFDFFAFFLVLILGALLVWGARESILVNNALTALNMIIIVFIIVGGAVNSSFENWYISENELPPENGSGGFFPYGVMGTMKGAAVCFYAFVGFDTITSAAEEARDSRKSIPMTILIALGCLFCIYAAVSIVITTMVPYHQQDSIATVAAAFSYVGWEWAKWIIYVGTICGICASLIGAMYPLPRLLYAMSSDGLSLHWFNNVTKKRKTPAAATIVPTIIIAVLAGVLETNQLIMMMCIGTLLSYTLVAVSVIVLRYYSDAIPTVSQSYHKQIFGCRSPPSKISTRVIYTTLILFIFICIIIALVGVYGENVPVPLGVLHAVAFFIIIVMAMQPKVKEDIYFKTPLVPLIPCISIYINIQLMVLINIQTWIRVAVWTVIGIIVYVLCLNCYKRNKNNYLQKNTTIFTHVGKNGKPSVQIVVESPTPPGTVRSNSEGIDNNIQIDDRCEFVLNVIEEIKDDTEMKTEENIIQQAVIETNYEKEAKIIDLLDQVLQAEEDSYGEIISLKDDNNVNEEVTENVIQRKSLGELSDAGSDISLGNQGLSKYDVIAQVHREDLSVVSEEEEKDDGETINEHVNKILEANQSETNSRTDESGYSDTFDKMALNDSIEDVKEARPYIPAPPPFDENVFEKSYLKKSYSMPKAKIKPVDVSLESEEETRPGENLQSNNPSGDNSNGDDYMIFGSEKQIDFMSKLSNIFQNKINTENEEQEHRKRSHSIGDATEHIDSTTSNRPLIFEDLKKEIIANKGKTLRPTNIVDNSNDTEPETQVEDDENSSMSRQDLKTKLESIFANGGTKLVKPRLMKSNPPTPEEVYQTDSSSSESIYKNAKTEKNDTLNRQKAKFSVVLNSFRESLNTDDKV